VIGFICASLPVRFFLSHRKKSRPRRGVKSQQKEMLVIGFYTSPGPASETVEIVEMGKLGHGT
jgi:hypothetical protein